MNPAGRRPALSFGPGVETRCFDGRVHSVFRRLCNVEISGRGMIALARADVANGPRTIRINFGDGFSFSTLDILGRPVACRAGIVRIGGAEFSIDLRPAAAWTQALPVTDTYSRASARRNFDHLRAVVEAAPARRALSAWRLITMSAAPGYFAPLPDDPCLRALARLVGLGPGLTPAGDDFVAGFMLALGMHQRASAPAARLMTAIGGAIEAWAAKTTDISAWMLRDAASGHFTEPVVALGAVLVAAAAGPARLISAANSVLALGDTSGAATILGLLSGTEWARPGFEAAAGSLKRS